MSEAVQNDTIAFGFNQAFEPFTSGARTFPRHYLLYASTGAFTLTIDDKEWLLPPHRAAWIAADVELQVQARLPVTCSSVLYAKDSIPDLGFDCRVFAVSPLAREMILYAMQWGPDRDAEDKDADRFFLTLASICLELVEHPAPFWLPRARSAVLKEALTYTRARLDQPLSFPEVAAAVGASERTLARRFAEEAHMSWGEYLRRVRMIRAMELLAEGTATVSQIALDVGFTSMSAFTKAFRRFANETPKHYQKRFQ